jgi:hypothetical protein
MQAVPSFGYPEKGGASPGSPRVEIDYETGAGLAGLSNAKQGKRRLEEAGAPLDTFFRDLIHICSSE